MFVFRKRRLVIYMKVRIEVVKCANCKMNNHFLYLSDFSYGERLVLFDNGTKYAYIDLLQDSVYSDFIDKVKEILGSYKAEVSGNVFQNMIDNMFSMTCDKIDGSNVDFVMNHKKCINCSSDSFEDSIVEPERSIYVDLPNITHNAWMSFTDGEKKERIKQELLRQSENLCLGNLKTEPKNCV